MLKLRKDLVGAVHLQSEQVLNPIVCVRATSWRGTDLSKPWPDRGGRCGEANRLRQLLIRKVLQHEPDRSGGESPLCEHWILLHRHDHDLHLRSTLAQLSDRSAA